MKYKRVYFQEVKSRINSERKFIQAITGPRQVGKTTIIKQVCQDIDFPFQYVSADNVTNASSVWIEQQWETARLKLKTSDAKEFLLIIDEIQKINNWSETVKQLWDKDTFEQINIKLVILGSSGLMIQEGLNESLAGRFELFKMPHWSFNEMNTCFSFSAEQFAWFGGYPGSAELIGDEGRWKDYILNSLIEATISKDILMLTNINKPALMRQVFELSVNYSSQILSFNKMLGQLQDAGNTTTISHYLQLLDTAGLISGVSKFYHEEYRKKTSSKKWQVKNSALFSALSNSNFNTMQQNAIKWGQVIESAIGAHLINMSTEGKYEVMYWRHLNNEVDFVLRKNNELIAIEVKSGITKRTKGMSAFKSKYNPKKLLLVGTEGLLWQDFLKLNPADLF